MKNAIIFLLIAACAGLSAFALFKSKKMAYVNTYQLYEQFTLKKELEDKLKKTQLSRQAILDSIKARIQLTTINKTIDANEAAERVQELKENYYIKEKQYMQDNENQAQQYTSQVWEQLNQYVKEFGKERHYQYILGATGQGGMMYADEGEDVSKELIEYVNQKYQGVK